MILLDNDWIIRVPTPSTVLSISEFIAEWADKGFSAESDPLGHAFEKCILSLLPLWLFLLPGHQELGRVPPPQLPVIVSVHLHKPKTIETADHGLSPLKL